MRFVYIYVYLYIYVYVYVYVYIYIYAYIYMVEFTGGGLIRLGPSSSYTALASWGNTLFEQHTLLHHMLRV